MQTAPLRMSLSLLLLLAHTGCGGRQSTLADAATPADSTECPGPKPLSDFCRADTCADTLADQRELTCGAHADVWAKEYSNSCGGKTLTRMAGLGEVQWHFDANEELIGVHEFTDTANACTESGKTISRSDTEYGKSCEVRGTARPACGDITPGTDAGADAETPSDDGGTESVDFSCNVDADCEVKDIGNCCGAYPRCVNQASPTPPVKCAAGEGSACGFATIDSCSCRAHTCRSLQGGNEI